MSDLEKEARRLCKEALTQILEAEFRAGTIPQSQADAAAAATLRTVEKLWREWLPDARASLGKRDE